MSGTLEISEKLFDLFPVAFTRVLYKLRNHTNNKGKVRSTMQYMYWRKSVLMTRGQYFELVDEVKVADHLERESFRL